MPAHKPKAMAMEARQEADLPRGQGWQFEPKWDGFRCLARRSGDKVELLGRSGKDLGRYFPDLVAGLRALRPSCFRLDGELVIPVGDVLSFEELQLRLHPAASRVARLAAAHPSRLVVFDMLESTHGRDLAGQPLRQRREVLESFFEGLGTATGPLLLSPATLNRATARRWLARAGAGQLDGVVAKCIDDPYLAGERAMIKVKRLRTADCVVGGYRYTTRGNFVGSLLLGLFNEQGLLDHVGFMSAIADSERGPITRRVEALRGGVGFSGAAPGGPSRWSSERSSQWQAIRPSLVVEVQYDQATGRRFRHATRFVRWRPDKAPRDCRMDQLRVEAKPAKLIAQLRT